MKQYKRVLVLSNNCFSKTDSNGRTLGNLFEGWPKSHLAQMCVIVKDPDWDVCVNYYSIEDQTMLKSFLHLRKCEGKLVKRPENENQTISVNTKRGGIGKKNLIRVILRELVWANNRWFSKGFKQWLDDFNPEVLVLQFGDTGFMLDIAMILAQVRQIPLVIYNTEGYYFFPYNWHHKTKIDWLLFPFYKRCYCKKVKRLMNVAAYCIYANQKLKDDYDKEFGSVPSSLIYASSNLTPSDKPLFTDDAPLISYLGNLGLDRDSALVSVGNVLRKIDSNYSIDVYGGASEEVIQRLSKASGVKYHGFVTYDEVKKVISESDILFHVETEKGYKERQLQYAFSTKIADSIASGRCFVLYAPHELACSQYIKDTGAGWVAESEEDLEAVVRKIINNSHERTSVINKELSMAKLNHNYETNAERFREIICVSLR